MRTPWPAPPAFAIAALGMLVQERTDWNIYGGNIASTLAGEYSFEIALALALFALGALAYTLDTGKRPWLPAVLIAAAIMSHIVVAIFVGVAAVLLWLVRSPRRTWPIAVAVGAVGLALTAVWSLPLLGQQAYTQSMRYAKVFSTGSTFKLPYWIFLPEPGEAHDRGPRARRRAATATSTRQGDLADAVVAVVDLDPRRGRDHRRRLVPAPLDARAAPDRAGVRRVLRRVARARGVEHAVPAVLAAHVGLHRGDGRGRARAARRARPSAWAFSWISDGDLAGRARPRVGRGRARRPGRHRSGGAPARGRGARRAALRRRAAGLGTAARISIPSGSRRRSRVDRDDARSRRSSVVGGIFGLRLAWSARNGNPGDPRRGLGGVQLRRATRACRRGPSSGR